VAIRTLVLEDGDATMGVGGGIVIDSEPHAEFRECQLKAEFLARTAERFSLIETMLWDGRYPLIELHLDRLADSADYFGFSCDRAAIHSALLAKAALFPEQRPRKVRLLLDSDGTIRIVAELIGLSSAEPVRVSIAAERTDPNDRFLFHKTTNRKMYHSAFATASHAGFDDVLFVNTDGELTEGAISNVLIEKGGRWYTPPVACGLLPGVYRRFLLESRADLEEKVLTLDDVRNADAVYICNAVRGLRRATVEPNSMP
jgi:para-aminobenzoate synthetase/4-amino-4-deoxychorismate lyase